MKKPQEDVAGAPASQSAAGGATAAGGGSPVTIPDLAAAVDSLSSRCRRLERVSERQRTIIEEMRAHVRKIDEACSKEQTELAYAQQQLEYLVVRLEREHGIVADHTEQLRLFVGESRGRGGFDSGNQSSKSVLLVLGNWLYMPVIHFAKGVYTLLAPIINTAQSLSLFNSEVLQRFTDENLRARWGSARNGDLLVKLQKGTLDPPSVSSRKSSGP